MSVFAVAAGFELSEQQREVVTRLLTAGNGIDAVVGVAGAGKSTLMDACRIAWDATGTMYAGACLSAVGAQGLQDASAIPSRTVASWLKRIESGEGLTGIDVLVVDEAVMTDDRSAAKLLTEAARTGTQVLAIGDPKQLQAVGIGGWFAEVHRLVGGLTLDENRRQRDDAERAALDIWRTGDHRKALEVLAAAERVHPAATADEARSQMRRPPRRARQRRAGAPPGRRRAARVRHRGDRRGRSAVVRGAPGAARRGPPRAGAAGHPVRSQAAVRRPVRQGTAHPDGPLPGDGRNG
ncbi:AAA family ATPase [Streptomyces coelicoflavus]|uniref:AAA family ATPase n=1 Tax=Streptomyces coelicoflavus TaxID=285562 RepID=UPI00364F042B